MKFRLVIEADNSAFQPDPREEITRLLSSVQEDLIEVMATEGRLFDINGNLVGKWVIE